MAKARPSLELRSLLRLACDGQSAQRACACVDAENERHEQELLEERSQVETKSVSGTVRTVPVRIRRMLCPARLSKWGPPLLHFRLTLEFASARTLSLSLCVFRYLPRQLESATWSRNKSFTSMTHSLTKKSPSRPSPLVAPSCTGRRA